MVSIKRVLDVREAEHKKEIEHLTRTHNEALASKDMNHKKQIEFNKIEYK